MHKSFLYVLLFVCMNFMIVQPAARSSSAAAAAAAGALKKPTLTSGGAGYYRWPHYLTTKQTICGTSPHLSGDIDRKESASHFSPPPSCTTALQHALWFSALDDFFQTVPEFTPGLRKLVCEYATSRTNPNNSMFRWSDEIATAELSGQLHTDTQWQDNNRVVYLEAPVTERVTDGITYLVQHDTNNPLASIKIAVSADKLFFSSDKTIIAAINSKTWLISFFDAALNLLGTHQLNRSFMDLISDLYWSPNNSTLCVQTVLAKIIICTMHTTAPNTISTQTYCTHDLDGKKLGYFKWAEDSRSIKFEISTGCTHLRFRPFGAENTWQPYTLDIPSNTITKTSLEIDRGFEHCKNLDIEGYHIRSCDPSTLTLTLESLTSPGKKLSLRFLYSKHIALLTDINRLQVNSISSFQENLLVIDGALHSPMKKFYKSFTLIFDTETRKVIQLFIHDKPLCIDSISPDYSKIIIRARGEWYRLLTPRYQPAHLYHYFRNMNFLKNYPIILKVLVAREYIKKLWRYNNLKRALIKVTEDSASVTDAQTFKNPKI